MSKTTTADYGIFTIDEINNAVARLETQPQKMTVSHFNDFLRLTHPQEFIYSDENNGEHKRNRITKQMHEPMFMCAYYSEIRYSVDMNGYILKNGKNYMFIAFVKYITVEPSILGDVVIFHCRYYNTDDTIAYTLIVR